MAYQLGQYNKSHGQDDDVFMTLITNGTARRKSTTSQTADIVFENECLQVTGGFVTNKNYYFHGKIKRMEGTKQNFTVKLINYETSSSEENIEQYIKSIEVPDGSVDLWYDIEFTFTPLTTFDCILFELQRIKEDYTQETRYPKIIYEEISEINNLIPRKINDGKDLIKIGIQSHPGLLMCINGEEIRISRTGVYEIKNGVITISFFSVVACAAETTSVLEDTIISINTQWNAATTEEARRNIQSVSLLNQPKTRQIDSFTIDYLYKED